MQDQEIENRINELLYRENELTDKLILCQENLMKIAKIMHYPDCWCTAAYPTLESAIKEFFTCSECE